MGTFNRFFKPDIMELGKNKDIKGLIKALQNKDWNIRAEAALTLGNIGDDRAVVPLIQTLKDYKWRVRVNTAEALGKIGDKMAVEPLIRAVKYSKKNVRDMVAWALIRIKKTAVKSLIETLNDDNMEIRTWAATTLGKIGDKRVIEPLTKALKTGDQDFWKAATEALEKIKSQ